MDREPGEEKRASGTGIRALRRRDLLPREAPKGWFQSMYATVSSSPCTIVSELLHTSTDRSCCRK